MADDNYKIPDDGNKKGMRFGYGRGQPSAYAPKQRFAKQPYNREDVRNRIDQARDKIQSRKEDGHTSQQKTGFEVQQSEFARKTGELTNKFRASFSREDEKALAEHLEQYNFRLGMYKEVDKDVRHDIADIAFSGTVERPRSGFSNRYRDIVDFPYKYSVNQHKPEDYDLGKSLWSKMRELPEFAAIEKKVVSEMA